MEVVSWYNTTNIGKFELQRSLRSSKGKRKADRLAGKHRVSPIRGHEMVSLLVKMGVAVAILTLASAMFLHNVSSSPSMLQNSLSTDGGISGRVLDANGQPITQMTIFAEREDIIIRPTPRGWTNKDGEFTIQGLMAGRYRLFSRKDEDGYPHTGFSFYTLGEGAEPLVEVYEHRTTPNVIIKLGPKAAVLVGRVVDSNTKQPLPHANITLRRVDHPERFLSTGLFWHGVKGGFRVLVPSLPFTIKVSEPGYQDWYFRRPSERAQASALLLPANSTKSLVVALRPRTRAK
jgi:hypothetical protein